MMHKGCASYQIDAPWVSNEASQALQKTLNGRAINRRSQAHICPSWLLAEVLPGRWWGGQCYRTDVTRSLLCAPLLKDKVVDLILPVTAETIADAATALLCCFQCPQPWFAVAQCRRRELARLPERGK